MEGVEWELGWVSQYLDMLLQLFLMLLLEASPVLQVLEKARPQDHVSHSRLITSSPIANISHLPLSNLTTGTGQRLRLFSCCIWNSALVLWRAPDDTTISTDAKRLYPSHNSPNILKSNQNFGLNKCKAESLTGGWVWTKCPLHPFWWDW